MDLGHLTLINPAIDYEQSYRDLLRELLERQEPLVPFPLQYPADDFPALIRRLDDASRGQAIPEGFVAHSTYWLVDSAKTVLGVSNLRHELTAKLKRYGGHIGYGIRPSVRGRGCGKLILKLTLSEARARAITNVLLTCGKHNLASARVILANGGIFESEEFVAEHNEMVQRYWIEN
jgi:predicted acetyltransferase